MNYTTLNILLLSFLCTYLSAQKNNLVYPILAHSHNDYEQKIPLFKALEHNFQSIEIDIIRNGNQLKVSHDREGSNEKVAIEELYLKPLQHYFISNENKNIWLLIDIKEYDKLTLDLLHEVISKYEGLFKRRKMLETEKPLQILLSGYIPRKEIMENKKYDFFFIDGRISDLKLGYDADLMPLISTNFIHHTKWNGKGKMDKDEELSILEAIQIIHKENKILRFWKTPDKKRVWKFLINNGVDLIGVDDIEKFSRFRSKAKFQKNTGQKII